MEKLTGHGIPSAHLVGEVGQHYEDLDTGDLYECRIAEQYSPTHGWPVGGYVWEKRATGEDIQELYGSGGENGPCSWNDLTDKPFDEKISAQTIFEQDLTDFTICTYYGAENTIQKYVSVGNESALVMNKQYRVTIDDDVYVCTSSDDGYSNPGLGTYSWAEVNKDDNYPFNIAYPLNENTLKIYLPGTDTSVSHYVKIETYESELKQIDPKYLPKADRVADITEAPTAENFNALLTSLRNAGYMN